MLNAFKSSAGEQLLRHVSETVANLCQPALSQGGLGGSRVWVDIALLGPCGAHTLREVRIDGAILSHGAGEPAARALMQRRRERSVRTGLSVKDAEFLGDTPLDTETAKPGNVVRNLTPDGTYKLVVSAGGLSNSGCEQVSELFALAVLVRVPGLLYADALRGQAEMLAATEP